MGLVAPQETTGQYVPQPLHPQVLLLRECIDEANKVPSIEVRRMLLNALNEKYRSTSYKKWFRQQVDSGKIQLSDQAEMEKMLREIRHSPRIPYAKSYRYNWF